MFSLKFIFKIERDLSSIKIIILAIFYNFAKSSKDGGTIRLPTHETFISFLVFISLFFIFRQP